MYLECLILCMKVLVTEEHGHLRVAPEDRWVKTQSTWWPPIPSAGRTTSKQQGPLVAATPCDVALPALLEAEEDAFKFLLLAHLVGSQALSTEQRQQLPTPCPALEAALPALLSRGDEEAAGWVVARLAQEERHRLRALCCAWPSGSDSLPLHCRWGCSTWCWRSLSDLAETYAWQVSTVPVWGGPPLLMHEAAFVLKPWKGQELDISRCLYLMPTITVSMFLE